MLNTLNKDKDILKESNTPNEIKNKFGILNIKSKYILNHIFSFILEKIKLDIIIYNSTLQEKFNIKIDYYKEFSGKRKEGERNGYGKEYSEDHNYLIFEGKYKNNKRNGKGKEYDDCHTLIF